MSSSGIDYSKWDHLDDSTSSSEEELIYPRVTRLEAPSQVSTKDGTITVQQTSTRTTGVVSPSTTETFTKKTQKSLEEYIQEWTIHGGTCSDLYWSQDRETVVLRMNISPHVKGSNINVMLEGAIVPYRNRHCASTTDTCALSISFNDTNKVLLEEQLPHAVYVLEEEEKEVEWMLEFVQGKKYLVITLYKATPMPNMTIWWKRPLMQFEEIDIHVFNNNNNNNNSIQFQVAWAKAHVQFQKNIAAGKHKLSKRQSESDNEQKE